MTKRLWLLGPVLILCLAISERGGIRDQAWAVAEEPTDKAGNHVKWQSWDFTWSIRPREGLSLTNVRFQGKSVLKFAGLVEIFVPYNKNGKIYESRSNEKFSGGDCYRCWSHWPRDWYWVNWW